MMGGLMSSIAVLGSLNADLVTRPRAQQSMPWRKDLDTFLESGVAF